MKKLSSKITCSLLFVSMLLLFWVNAQAQHPPINARTFNGTSDYYNLPQSVSAGFSGGKALTIEYWFQGTSLGNAFSLRGVQPTNIYLPTPHIGSGLLPLNPIHSLSNEGGWVGNALKINTPTSDIYDGNWHHIAMTWDQGKPNGFKSYVDGAVVAQRAAVNVPLPDLRVFVPTVGATNASGKLLDFTKGQIGRMRIWRVARTETEINESRNQDEDYPASANLIYQASSVLSPTDFNLQLPPAIPANPMTFNGTTNFVYLPRTVAQGISGKNAITIEYWFRGKNMQSAVRIQNGNDFIIAGYGNNPLKPTHVISSDGGFLNGVKINNDQIPTHVIDDNWHHIAMVWEQNKPDGFRSFVDGKLVENRASANVALPNLINVVPTVGAYDNNGVKVEFAEGQIGRVRIWTVALTQTQIKASMSQVTDYPSYPNLVYQGINSGTVSITTQPAVAQPPVSVTPVRFMTLSPTPITLDLPVKVSDDISVGNAVTIEYWFKGKNIQSTVRFQSGSEFIVAGWGPTKDPVHIISTDGSIAGGVKINNGVDVHDGKWHHVAMTWQANDKFKSYVDGALVAERPATPSVKLPNLKGVIPVVGAWNDNQTFKEYTEGDVGRIRIWKVARTEAQIKESKDRVANYPNDPNLLYQQ